MEQTVLNQAMCRLAGTRGFWEQGSFSEEPSKVLSKLAGLQTVLTPTSAHRAGFKPFSLPKLSLRAPSTCLWTAWLAEERPTGGNPQPTLESVRSSQLVVTLNILCCKTDRRGSPAENALVHSILISQHAPLRS